MYCAFSEGMPLPHAGLFKSKCYIKARWFVIKPVKCRVNRTAELHCHQGTQTDCAGRCLKGKGISAMAYYSVRKRTQRRSAVCSVSVLVVKRGRAGGEKRRSDVAVVLLMSPLLDDIPTR